MESFLRYYYQIHRYIGYDDFEFSTFGSGCGGAGVGYEDYKRLYPHGTTYENRYAWVKQHLVPFPGGDKKAIQKFAAETVGTPGISGWNREINHGLELQYAKALRNHDVIASVTHDISRNYTRQRADPRRTQGDRHEDRSRRTL